jgi:hypothetical protein
LKQLKQVRCSKIRKKSATSIGNNINGNNIIGNNIIGNNINGNNINGNNIIGNNIIGNNIIGNNINGNNILQSQSNLFLSKKKRHAKRQNNVLYEIT